MQVRLSKSDLATAHIGGLLYLVIIVFGISAEVLLRGPLVDVSSAIGTAEAIQNASGSFRLAIVADIVMAMADAALAVLLFVLFRAVAPMLALAAMVFRLIQSALIGANLMNMQAAWLLLSGGQDLSTLTPEHVAAMANLFLNLHAHGYDLGLFFFGVNSLLTGVLIWKSGFVPKGLGAGIVLAGIVYLIGSTLRFSSPEMFALFAPAYGLTLLTEAAFCIWLLMAGRFVRTEQSAT